MRSPHTTHRTAQGPPRDEGMALMFAIVFVVIGSMIVMPLLTYASTVAKSSRILQSKTARAEAVKAAFRTTMGDPTGVYALCDNTNPLGAGINTPVALPDVPLDIAIDNECYWQESTQQAAGGTLRLAMTTTFAGSAAPPYTVGDIYSGAVPDYNYWPTDATPTSTGGKIFLPPLPVHSTKHPATSGYMMPSWAGPCRVFFPGTYDDPVTISDATPTFFASGVYYFTDTVTFTGSANVVVGGGAVEGCTTNQDAAYFAINAPSTHNITGYGATFVFGGAGRMVISDTTTPGNGVNVTFNDRLVAEQEPAVKASASVSIMTVNGTLAGTTIADTDIAGQLFVPETLVSNGTSSDDATANDYTPSTLLPVADPVPGGTSVLDVSLTASNPSSVNIYGYVAVPQGMISLTSSPAAAANKAIAMIGGVLAGRIINTVDVPATTQVGMVNRVTQQTFKIVSTTRSGLPVVTSEAIVKINEYGRFVVVNWSVQS
jgi:hypothetical protein